MIDVEERWDCFDLGVDLEELEREEEEDKEARYFDVPLPYLSTIYVGSSSERPFR